MGEWNLSLSDPVFQTQVPFPYWPTGTSWRSLIFISDWFSVNISLPPPHPSLSIKWLMSCKQTLWCGRRVVLEEVFWIVAQPWRLKHTSGTLWFCYRLVGVFSFSHWGSPRLMKWGQSLLFLGREVSVNYPSWKQCIEQAKISLLGLPPPHSCFSQLGAPEEAATQEVAESRSTG